MKSFHVMVLILFFSGPAIADTFHFTSSIRVFGFSPIMTQPAIFSGEFSLHDNWINQLAIRMHLLPENEIAEYEWVPELTAPGGRFGWIQNEKSHLEVVIDGARAKIKVDEVGYSSLKDLGREIRTDISFICPHLPAEVNQSVECSLGLTSGFEMPHHDNPMLRSLEMEPLSDQSGKFAPVTIVRLR